MRSLVISVLSLRNEYYEIEEEKSTYFIENRVFFVRWCLHVIIKQPACIVIFQRHSCRKSPVSAASIVFPALRPAERNSLVLVRNRKTILWLIQSNWLDNFTWYSLDHAFCPHEKRSTTCPPLDTNVNRAAFSRTCWKITVQAVDFEQMPFIFSVIWLEDKRRNILDFRQENTKLL